MESIDACDAYTVLGKGIRHSATGKVTLPSIVLAR